MSLFAATNTGGNGPRVTSDSAVLEAMLKTCSHCQSDTMKWKKTKLGQRFTHYFNLHYINLIKRRSCNTFGEIYKENEAQDFTMRELNLRKRLDI